MNLMNACMERVEIILVKEPLVTIDEGLYVDANLIDRVEAIEVPVNTGVVMRDPPLMLGQLLHLVEVSWQEGDKQRSWRKAMPDRFAARRFALELAERLNAACREVERI